MKNQVITPRVLILGATGMLGRIAFAYLRDKWPATVWGTSRQEDDFLRLDASKSRFSLRQIEKQIGRIDYVINCIGVLRGFSQQEELVRINTLLPLLLARYCVAKNVRLLHVSTDAVFADDVGLVTENDPLAPGDAYAQSKALGEPDSSHALSVRTSILGCDPHKHKGLIELVRTSQGVIRGFSNQKFSGCTVLELSQFFYDVIDQNMFDSLRACSCVIHFAPRKAISKFVLIKTIAEVFNGTTIVEKRCAPVAITRSLVSQYVELIKLSRYNKTLATALAELKAFEEML